MGIRLMLNLALRDNYAFVDPDALVHLNVSNPRGEATRLTGSVIRGVQGKTLIDVDGVIDLKNRCIIDKSVKMAQIGDLLDKEGALDKAEEIVLAEAEAVSEILTEAIEEAKAKEPENEKVVKQKNSKATAK